MKRSKLLVTSCVLSIGLIGTGMYSSRVQAATRDFINTETNKVYKATDWKSDSTVFDNLVNELSGNSASKYVVEFGGQNYKYDGLLNALVNRGSKTLSQAFTNALQDTSLIASTTNKTLTVSKVGVYNYILGYVDVTVNDSSLVTGIKVNGTTIDKTNFRTPNATTVRIFTDAEPTSIVLTTAKGDIVAKGSTQSTTLTVTNVGNYNDVLCYLDITVNDSSLVTGVIIDGKTLPSSEYKNTLRSTLVRIFYDTKPTSIIFTTTNGNIVVKDENTTTTPTPITISKLTSINKTINQGDSYSLPSTVQATMSDGSSKNVSVTWDKSVDTSQVGTFTYNGVVSGYDGKAVLTLTVNAKIISDLELVGNTSTIVDKYGETYIVGTIKNNTNKTYSYVEVDFNLYDTDGNQVGSNFINIINLDPNGTWNFKCDTYTAFSTYKLVKISGIESKDTITNNTNLELIDTPTVITDRYGEKYITGSIKNNANTNYSYVEVDINLYDSNGNLLGDEFSNITGLESNGIWKFKVDTNGINFDNYKIVKIIGN